MGAPLHCIFCGTANRSGDRYCRLCRSPLGSGPGSGGPDLGPATHAGSSVPASAVLIALGLVLAASAMAFAARGPILGLVSHASSPGGGTVTVPAAPAQVPTPSPAHLAPRPVPTPSPAHGLTSRPTCGPASEHGQGNATGRNRDECQPAAVPRSRTQPLRTPRPTETPEGRAGATGSSGDQGRADLAVGARAGQAAALSGGGQATTAASTTTSTAVTTRTSTSTSAPGGEASTTLVTSSGQESPSSAHAGSAKAPGGAASER